MAGSGNIALITLLVLIAGAILSAVWWWVPKRQMRGLTFENDKDRAATEDNFRKTVGQVIGGAAVLVGALFAYLQFSQQQNATSEQFAKQQDAAAKEALRQQTAANEQLKVQQDAASKQQEAATQQLAAQQEASRNSLKASQDLLISNQVAKGFEQLAGEKTTMRLGGIYALEGVMNQFRAVSSAGAGSAVRLRAREHDTPARIAGQECRRQTQRHAGNGCAGALTVIGRRAPGPGCVDLQGANIRGANLLEAHPGGAVLGGAHLEEADLRGAHLDGAVLIGAHLEAPTSVGRISQAPSSSRRISQAPSSAGPRG